MTVVPESVAVVGVSLRLPGDANDTDGLWSLLASGKPAWTPVPADRYNEEAFFHPNADDPNGTSNHPGGHFISGDIQDFDHAFFRFTKSQAGAIDPQQRLLMELTYEALENAGIPREQLAGSPTSCYTAFFPMDHAANVFRDPLDLPTYYLTGVQEAILSNRLSHVFDLRGPSMSIDTACSGGLVALHQACQSLQLGESDTSIVAASNLILGPNHHIGLSNLHMLSSTGRCYPFDDRGKGYGRGEGVVVLILKRLQDALRDNDPVRAVIRSTAIGQDGYTPQSITYPNGQAQADLARTAYLRAGLRPEDVSYIEAHGTGTKAGDPEELNALADVFASDKRETPLYVGSIKGAIGHSESAAGLASLVKVIEILDRELIPPVAGFVKAKPGLPLDKMQIPTTVTPWPHANGIVPRVSINSFGFGGANAHAIVERGPRTIQARSESENAPLLFNFSANNPTSLKLMIQAYYDWIRKQEDGSLADLSYTLLHRRSALPYRYSIVAESSDGLGAGLLQAVLPNKPAFNNPDLIMIFTGQGAQWAGMGRELLSEGTDNPFNRSIRQAGETLHALGANWDLKTELLREAATSRLGEAELAQPSSTAVQLALVDLLRSWNITPRAVLGHSSGEIGAAYAAGHISHATALKIAYHRGFMSRIAKLKGLGRGAMLSVGLGESDAAPYLKGLRSGKAVIACINSPRSVTISGDSAAVDEVADRIVARNDGTFQRKLLVDTAYHSHHMQQVAGDFRDRLGVLDPVANGLSNGHTGALSNGTLGHNGQREPNIARSEEVVFVSSVTGEIKSSKFDAEYFVANLQSPVRFSDALQSLLKTQYHPGQQIAFLEVGPHPALAGPVRQCTQAADMPKVTFDYQSPLQRGANALISTLKLAGKLFENGTNVDWASVSSLSPGASTAVVRSDLPSYPWDHSTKHWHESRVSRAYRLRKEPYHDLVGLSVAENTSIEPRWRHFLSRTSFPWLSDHVVDGLAVFPGAGYMCMAIEAVSQLARQRFPQRSLETLVLSDIRFKRGLVVPDPPERIEVQIGLLPRVGKDLGFGFSITALSDSGEWYEHCNGNVEGILGEDDATFESVKEEIPIMPPGSDTVQHEQLYDDMDKVGNNYGPTFRALRYITFAPDASQCVSAFAVPNVKDVMPGKHQVPHVIHPSTLDIIFHTALPLVGRRLGPGSIMPTNIEEMLISTKPQLHVPGSDLDVSASLSESHFRTAVSDLNVLAAGRRVLSITGMEFRSLGSRSQTDDVVSQEMCYSLDWRTPIAFAKIPTSHSLTGLLTSNVLGPRLLSGISLGVSIDISEEIVSAVKAEHSLSSYDFVATTPGRFDEAVKRLKGVPIKCRTLRPDTNPSSRGFPSGSYDIVSVGSARWLKSASTLVRSDGIVLLVLSVREAMNNEWQAALNDTTLQQQLGFKDDHQRFIAVLKPKSVLRAPVVDILTHSSTSVATWSTNLRKSLASTGALISTEPLKSGLSITKSIVVVADDLETPILSEPAIYKAATSLMCQPAHIIWLSPNDPPEFHQIEGVARTAHGENDDLQLTTIHAASSFLSDFSSSSPLYELLIYVINQLYDTEARHTEREYRMRSDGSVVIPRLQHNDELNAAIASDGIAIELTSSLFSSQEGIRLSAPDSELFVQELNLQPLGSNDIEIETTTFALPKAGRPPSLGEYAGIVKAVGDAVRSFAIGDAVVAVSETVGANRLRVSAAHAGHRHTNVPAEFAVSLLADLMSAFHALKNVARLYSSGGTILVHGALTASGRAVFATGRSIGLRVVASAADVKEAKILEEQLGISTSDIVIIRRSLHRPSTSSILQGGLDAVFQAIEEPLTGDILSYIRPFGSVVALGTTGGSWKLPPNVSSYVVDIASILKHRVDLKQPLISQAASALGLVPLSGLEISTRDVSDISEALRLVNTGVVSKAILQASERSEISLIPTPKYDPWSNENATYLIAGGLGDIGQRFLQLMARRGAAHLATISRRVVNAEAHHELLTKLQAIRPGVHLYTVQADVSSEESVKAAATQLAAQGAPPVHGVIMAATFMNDRPLELSTWEDHRSVTKIKVDGTPNLYHAFASPDLAFFLSLSSVASLVGAQAEASYNAGNALQDSLAHERYWQGTRFLTINFGWIEDAVLTAGDEVREGALRRAGFSLIRKEQLSRFYDKVLQAALAPDTTFAQAVIGFDTQSLAGSTAHNGNIQSAMFDAVREQRGSSNATGDDDASGSQQTFEQVLAQGDAEATTAFVTQAVANQLARLISVDASSIDTVQASILALGLDSLVAVELRNWIVRQFDAPLQSTEILANQTVHALAGKVLGRSKKVT